MKPGLVRGIGHDGQSVLFEHPHRRNKAVWLHVALRTLRTSREHLWSAPMIEALENAAGG